MRKGRYRVRKLSSVSVANVRRALYRTDKGVFFLCNGKREYVRMLWPYGAGKLTDKERRRIPRVR